MIIMATMNLPKADTVPSIIYDTLNELGVPQHLLGYQYLAYTVYIVNLDSNVLHRSMTKEIYPAVAKVFDTKPNRVERAIRHAQVRALQKCNESIIRKYFGNSVSTDDPNASNSQVIYAISNKLKRYDFIY